MKESVTPPYKEMNVPLATELFLDQIRYRVVEQGRNLIFLFMGDVGTGKSWGAVNFGRLFDPWFSMDKVVYEPAEFFDALDRVEHRGEVIIWDEAGVGMPSREWNSLFNRVVSKTLQIFREATPGRIVLIFATPRKIFMDKAARLLLNMEWRFHWDIGEPHPYAIPYQLKYIIHYKTKTMEDYTIYQLPVVRYKNLEIKIRRLYMAALPPDLAKKYRAKSVPRKFQLRFQYALLRAMGENFPTDLSNWLYEKIVSYGIDDFLVDLERTRETARRFNKEARDFDLLMFLLGRASKTPEDKLFYEELKKYFMGDSAKAEIMRSRFTRYLIGWLTKAKEEVIPRV